VILWIDAQLSPALARWMSETFDVTAHAVRDLGLQGAKDLPIFHAARKASEVHMSEDSDVVLLLERHGPPPQILWVACGKTSHARLRDVLRKSFPEPGHVWSKESHSSESLMRANRARSGHKAFMKRIWLPSSHGSVEGYR
jgi:predicted nuclease of predicted toxin-antitoxin system